MVCNIYKLKGHFIPLYYIVKIHIYGYSFRCAPLHEDGSGMTHVVDALAASNSSYHRNNLADVSLIWATVSFFQNRFALSPTTKILHETVGAFRYVIPHAFRSTDHTSMLCRVIS